jgi:RHS repeat-associated protein
MIPGETVRMEVFGKYVDLKEAKSNPAIMAVLMGLAGGNGLTSGVDGSLIPQARAVPGNQGLSALMTGKKDVGNVPPAYLNYLFFDSQMDYQYGGFVQMSEAAWEDGTNRPHERLYQEVVAGEPGYFYIYLSNDSPQGMESEAFFDDFSVQTSESYIVQTIDYYPYGLISVNNVRTGDKPTNELFQGKTYDELTKWYDFHARQYDPALGRWFGVDPQNQFSSPYLAMGNNPVMMVDPDGELAFLAIAAIIGKAVAVGAAVNAASYALNTAMTGQSWNWGQFGAQVGKGAAIGGLTAGAGMGFSAGLGAVGVGVKASNFMGGALGSFAGTLAGGGMPHNPIEWATAIGGSALTGNAFKNSNPLSLKRTGNDFSLNGFDGVGVLLPPVDYTDMSLGNFPSWWGQTNLLRNDVARAVALQGAYNGTVDAFSRFFQGDRVEANWYANGDGSYTSLWHSKFTSGTAPDVGAGGLGNLKKARQLRNLIRKGNAPSGIDRLDIPGLDRAGNVIHGQKPHIHFGDRALNLDRTWKHGSGSIPKWLDKWLNQHGI